MRFLAFRSSARVQKYIAPSSQIPSNGVTCGRPSGRTDDSQYTSASSSTLRPCVHSVGTAPSLLKPAKVVVGSRSITRFPPPPQHSAHRPVSTPDLTWHTSEASGALRLGGVPPT